MVCSPSSTAPKANPCLALLGTRVQLPEGQDGLALVLLVEGQGDPEAGRVIVEVSAVVHHQPRVSGHLEVVEAVRVGGSVRRHHVEASASAGTDVHLVHLAGEPVGPEPLAEAVGFDPGGVHGPRGRVDDLTRTISRSSDQAAMVVSDAVLMASPCGC